jgi:hypothetical protein
VLRSVRLQLLPQRVARVERLQRRLAEHQEPGALAGHLVRVRVRVRAKVRVRVGARARARVGVGVRARVGVRVRARVGASARGGWRLTAVCRRGS